MKGPQFLVYLRPLVEVLKNIGGSGSTADVIDQVIEYMKIPEEEVAKTIAQEHRKYAIKLNGQECTL